MDRTYPDAETKLSRSYLQAVAGAVKDPVLLLGGWGVYFTVTSAYVRTFGRDYSFSRDIDLGFHLDPGWGAEQIKKSSLGRSVRALGKLGFVGEGYRMRMDFAHDGGRRLSKDESRALQTYEIAKLYVDPMVDYPHPLRAEALGFTAAEETELMPLFERRGLPRMLKVMDRLRLPPRETLVRMKLKSMPDRSADHKVQKDVADVFALLSTYGRGPAALVAKVGENPFAPRFLQRLGELGAADWAAIAGATGVQQPQLRTVLAALRRVGGLVEADRAMAKAKVDELIAWGTRIKGTYVEQKRSWQDKALAGPWGAFVGGVAAEALGFSKRAGRKWGRTLATSRAKWPDSPPELSLRAEADEWLRAVKSWAESHEILPRPGDRARGTAPLLRRYESILEVQTVPARIGRGLAFLSWARERDIAPIAK